MKKLLLSTVFVGLFFASAKEADAAILTFSREGELYWNVLGLTDSEDSALEIKKIGDDFSPNKNESVALVNESGKVYLSYGAAGKKVDVTGYSGEIIEIEEADAPSRVLIEATESGFAISQRGIIAETSFPISINSPENKLSVETANGNKFLSVLPFEAVRLITKTNMISSVSDGGINLIEKEEGELAYEVNGQKFITLFKVFSFAVPIKVEVSAISGKVVHVDQPLWYSFVGFFLA